MRGPPHEIATPRFADSSGLAPTRGRGHACDDEGGWWWGGGVGTMGGPRYLAKPRGDRAMVWRFGHVVPQAGSGLTTNGNKRGHEWRRRGLRGMGHWLYFPRPMRLPRPDSLTLRGSQRRGGEDTRATKGGRQRARSDEGPTDPHPRPLPSRFGGPPRLSLGVFDIGICDKGGKGPGPPPRQIATLADSLASTKGGKMGICDFADFPI